MGRETARSRVIPSLRLTQAAAPLMLNSSGFFGFQPRRNPGFAGSRLLSRQMFRRSLLSLAVHALSSRAHRAGCELRVSRAGAPCRGAVRRERVHRRRECDRGLQIFGVAADHMVVRSPPVGVPDAAGPREFSGLPARSELRGAQVFRSHLHFVHQFSGAHRHNALSASTPRPWPS